MICPNCGATVGEGQKFCTNCGTPLSAGAPAPEAPQETAQPEESYTQPETGYTQPEGGYTQPEGGYTQPESGYTQPETGYTQPEGGYTQPVVNAVPQGGGYYGPMMGGTNRNIALCVIFTIISCGFYAIYWMVKLNEELNVMAGETEYRSGGMVVLLSIVTCGIYAIYWIYQMGKRVDTIKERTGVPSANSPMIFLILSIFGLGIVSYCMMQDAINKAVG